MENSIQKERETAQPNRKSHMRPLNGIPKAHNEHFENYSLHRTIYQSFDQRSRFNGLPKGHEIEGFENLRIKHKVLKPIKKFERYISQFS